MGKITDIKKWRVELTMAEKFKEEQFGSSTKDKREGAAININYYENGFSDTVLQDIRITTGADILTTVNIIDAIVSVIVPSLYFKNPKTIATPTKIESEDSAPFAAKIIDYYRRRCESEESNKMAIWDAYVLGYGVTKVGYATKFGVDIKDEEKEKERKRSETLKYRIDKGLEALGIKKPKEEEVVRPEVDLRIIAESPFISYVNPFDFGMDYRATNINDCMFTYQKFSKTLKELKGNTKYKNTKNLRGTAPDFKTMDFINISQSEIEDFHTVDLYEVHYRNENEFYLLVLACDDGDVWEELYHDVSIYDLGDWQYDILWFKKHGHSLYPLSDISKVRPLQDRITKTIDSILEQVDKFVPKLAFDKGGIAPNGENALKYGDIGAIVECTKNPAEVFKELNFTQLKADLQALIDQIISLISIQTGLTRAQLTGISDTGTATEATIAQGGQSIRIDDMSSKVQAFVNKQTRKLWRIITQFVDLEELQLINGIKGIDQNTGLPKYEWLRIDQSMSEKLRGGDYDFDIEVGSTQKISLAVVRKSFENMFTILARTEVLAIMQAQGDDIKLGELFKAYFGLYPEIGVDVGKVVQKINPQQRNLPLPGENRGGETSGSQMNQLRSQSAEEAPNMQQIMRDAAQI